MPKLAAYDRRLPYSYAPGVFPSHMLLDTRPACARRLLVHSQAAGSEGVLALTQRCRALGIRVEEADHALARISRKENCFAAMVFDKYQDALGGASSHIVLVSPSDMGNLGTILRTCLGFSLTDLAIIRPAADVFDPRVVRASMGAAFAMNVSLFDSFEDYRNAFPSHALYPFMLDASIPLDEAAQSKAEPYALIFGNEASGLPASFSGCGQPVRIPHNGRIDSLNLAVAVAIATYAFTSHEK